MNAPDLIEPVVGYRLWRIMDASLWPFFRVGSGLSSHPWQNGEAAKCRYSRHRPHAAPQSGCTCGYHAHHTHNLSRPGFYASYVGTDVFPNEALGAIAAHGRIEVHAEGFRAEYARPVVLALSPAATDVYAARLRRVAATYGAEVVPLSGLERSALRHGRPIPRSLYPVAA